MPIRPDQLALYGPDWETTSHRIRFDRAGGRCECTGECGGSVLHLDGYDNRCRNRHGEHRQGGAPGQCVVVLSTAHLDHDVTNGTDDNLIAFCEGCHLRYDQAQHRSTRERNRLNALGMVPLLDVEEEGAGALRLVPSLV